ncbi:TPA: hypothetical protein ACX6SG_002788 [Photobacterium damselae]
MNRYYQQGMSTLLITSMLLVVALIFSLASYKNLFYQIKRTQNEVLARQAHWAAEGGLECGFAEISNKSDVNTSLDKCKTVIDGQPLTLSIDTDDGKSVLISKTDNNYKKISKIIVAGGARSSGVIKSSADLFFNGNYEISPDYTNEPKNNKCNIIRYKRNIYLNKSYAPFSTVSNKDEKKICDDIYSTVKAQKRSELEKDVYKDIYMDLFKETFGVDRKRWKEIKEKYFFYDDKKNDNSCINKITDGIKKDERYIWITGDCVLDDADLKELPSVGSDKKSMFILVQNGVLNLGGEIGSSSLYNAMFYLFINETISVGDQWKDSAIDPDKDPKMYATSDEDEKEISADEFSSKTIAYLNGSHRPNGGFIFDAPGYVIYFRLSIDLSFDDSLIDDLLSPFGKPTWQQGSWHDF